MQSPGRIGMEKQIRPHVGELLLNAEKEIGELQRENYWKTQGKGLLESQKTRDMTMEEEGGDRKVEIERREGRKMEKRKEGKRDKAEQVLIGERPGGECQRYLLSQ